MTLNICKTSLFTRSVLDSNSAICHLNHELRCRSLLDQILKKKKIPSVYLVNHSGKYM